MDIKQMEYMVAIAEYGNITTVAKKLYISQSALSQQLISLEKELNVPLFIRNSKGLVLTQAGHIYIDNAKRILNIRNDTLNQLSGFKNGQDKCIVIGAATGRSARLFGEIYNDFTEKYPDYEIRLQETSSYEAERHVKEGKINLCITVLLPEDLKSTMMFSHECLQEEKLILCIPKTHPLVPANYSVNSVSECPPIDLSLFKSEPFVLPSLRCKTRHHIDQVFSESGYVPKVAYEIIDSTYILSSVKNGGKLCSIIPSGIWERSDKIAWFSIEDQPSMEYAICWNINHYLSDAEKYFIQLCKKHKKKVL